MPDVYSTPSLRVGIFRCPPEDTLWHETNDNIGERPHVVFPTTAVGLVRNPAHAADLETAGVVPVVVDLEAVDAAALAGHLDGADAVVFAAGAGPGSGVGRKDSVDRAAAALSPLAAVPSAGLPPTIVHTAEFDPLRDEGEELARRLAEEGVTTVGVRCLGQTHGFYRHAQFTASEPLVRQVSGFVDQHLA